MYKKFFVVVATPQTMLGNSQNSQGPLAGFAGNGGTVGGSEKGKGGNWRKKGIEGEKKGWKGRGGETEMK